MQRYAISHREICLNFEVLTVRFLLFSPLSEELFGFPPLKTVTVFICRFTKIFNHPIFTTPQGFCFLLFRKFSLSQSSFGTMASNQNQELQSVTDSELDSLRRQLCFSGGVTLQRVKGPAEWYLRPCAPEGSIVLGRKHLDCLRFPLPPLIHQFFALTGIHPMQLNANGIMILMGLSALSVIYNTHIDLEVVFYAYKLVLIPKKGSYPTFYLQPLPRHHIFWGLPRSDKQWDSHARLYTVGGAWCSPWLNGEHFQVPSVFLQSKHRTMTFGSEFSHNFIAHVILPCAASAEESRFEAHLLAGWLKSLEGIIIFSSPGECRHIQAVLNPLTMNLMPRMVLYLPFPLDTWVVTKHLRSRLDASALNRFRRDESDRITMVSRQVAASSQLAGTNDLVAPSNYELEEAVRLVAAECVRFREEENAAPKRVKGKFIFKSLNLRESGHDCRLTSSSIFHRL
ncbi:hypothetical protein PanWU01x14_195910 [Parasponia andersonii]|uniref:Uncharacterized protein n=1 Tax=Parasponia andersonii TaxID=3476 RepID=A0A2P5BZX0_PARAD|nr:hypothetical protein PanWU01x14_195910 [Parasponia andersonii]